jgi:hypothetical protein
MTPREMAGWMAAHTRRTRHAFPPTGRVADVSAHSRRSRHSSSGRERAAGYAGLGRPDVPAEHRTGVPRAGPVAGWRRRRGMPPPSPDGAAIAGWCRPSRDAAAIAGCRRHRRMPPRLPACGRGPDGGLVGLVRAGCAGRLAGSASAGGATGFHPSGPSAGRRGAPVLPGRRAPAGARCRRDLRHAEAVRQVRRRRAGCGGGARREGDARVPGTARGGPIDTRMPDRRAGARATGACPTGTGIPGPSALPGAARPSTGSRRPSPPSRGSRHSLPSGPRFSPLVPASGTSGGFVGCEPSFRRRSP